MQYFSESQQSVVQGVMFLIWNRKIQTSLEEGWLSTACEVFSNFLLLFKNAVLLEEKTLVDTLYFLQKYVLK